MVRVGAKRVRADIRADIGLQRAGINIIMYLREHVAPLVGLARELRHLDEVIRLGAGLLDRVVDEQRVALVPAFSLRGLGVAGLDGRVGPQRRQPLIADDAVLVVLGGKPEAVAAPDRDDAVALLGAQQLLAHAVHVARRRRRPDHHEEGLDAVAQEGARVRPLHEPRRVVPPVRPVQHRAVQVDDHEDLAVVRERERRQRRAPQVRRRRVRDAA